MASRQPVVQRGLEYRVSPGFWLRRWLRFPFYFESTNPSFRVYIKRIASAPVDREQDTMKIVAAFSDGSESAAFEMGLPSLEMGQKTHITLGSVYSPHPGQTAIRLVEQEPTPVSLRGAEWHGLYSYQVRTEEQIWLAVLGPLSGLGLTAIGVVIGKWLA